MGLGIARIMVLWTRTPVQTPCPAPSSSGRVSGIREYGSRAPCNDDTTTHQADRKYWGGTLSGWGGHPSGLSRPRPDGTASARRALEASARPRIRPPAPPQADDRRRDRDKQGAEEKEEAEDYDMILYPSCFSFLPSIVT